MFLVSEKYLPSDGVIQCSGTHRQRTRARVNQPTFLQKTGENRKGRDGHGSANENEEGCEFDVFVFRVVGLKNVEHDARNTNAQSKGHSHTNDSNSSRLLCDNE